MIHLLQNGDIAVFVLVLMTIVLSLSFHEFGHAYSALLLGDDTAQRMGRVTVNPLAHIDPVGLLMVVLIGFGYAKPVPTNPRNFKKSWAVPVVALAGPLANLIIAIVVLNLWLYGVKHGWPSFTNDGARQFFLTLLGINLVLMIFNLIPIGPLDGHYILPHLLPSKLARTYAEFNAAYGNYLFLGLVLLSIVGLPIFSFVRDVANSIIPYIAFVS